MPPLVGPSTELYLQRYAGKWYEIARLDHPFERGLQQVTAEYSLRDDGGITVKNRGYSAAGGKGKEAVGKAYFVRSSEEGYLKVSFFGPFYGSYVIFALDPEEYRYAFVSGPTPSYLWFLSRTPTVSQKWRESFVEKARELGFDTNRLIFVRQDAHI